MTPTGTFSSQLLRLNPIFAPLPAPELEARARAAWEHARRVHTRDNFRRVWRNYARDTLQLPLASP